MQDLDLDELDQAVNKMMDKSSRGKRAARSDSPAVPSRPVYSVKVDPAPTAVTTPDPEKSSEESPALPPSRAPESLHVSVNRPMPRVPERRRMHPGAMDIIQPSTPQKAAAPSSRPGRMAADLQPTKEVIPEPRTTFPAQESATPSQPEELNFKDDSPAPLAESEQKSARTSFDSPQEVSDEVLASLSLLDEPKPAQNLLVSEPQTDTPTALTDEPKKNDGWPDPLDFHEFGDKPDAPAVKEEPAPEAPVAADIPVEEPKETPPSMATEPVSVTDRHDDAASLASSPFVTTKVEKRPLGAFADAAHEPPKAVLPEPEAHVPAETTSKEEMASASLESKHHVSAPDEHDPTDLRSMTIPPQYHQGEQKPHDDIHHMYDTKEYHAPPQHMHTAHKSSPALVVGVVVLIVLIIAAVAVGYLMMTGAFDVSTLW
jgi:hypothetical protein